MNRCQESKSLFQKPWRQAWRAGTKHQPSPQGLGKYKQKDRALEARHETVAVRKGCVEPPSVLTQSL